MRILMVAHTFLPETRGGMENHAYQLSRFLLSEGHQVAVFYRIRTPELKEHQLLESNWEGLRVFQLRRTYRNPMPNPYPFYDRRIEVIFEQLLRTYRPDLIHFHHLADLTASLPTVARQHGIPSIMTLHDFWPMCFMSHLRTPDGLMCPGPDEGVRCAECAWKQSHQQYAPVQMRTRVRELGIRESVRRVPRFLADVLFTRLAAGNTELSHASLRLQMLSLPARNACLRQALTTCDLLISPSRFLMEKFVDWGIPQSRFRQIYNSAPAALLELRSSPREPHERTVFGFVGTLYPPKGVHVLLEAFKLLGSDRAALQIWGEVPAGASTYAEELTQRASGLPNLVFSGGFAPKDLPKVLTQMDVLVLPSTWYENNPLTILEAFAAGIPVLAGDVGGMAELVQHDVNGLQFHVGDPEDLAEKMRMMLEPERLARYRESIVPPWSHEEMGAVVKRIYQDLVTGRPG